MELRDFSEIKDKVRDGSGVQGRESNYKWYEKNGIYYPHIPKESVEIYNLAILRHETTLEDIDKRIEFLKQDRHRVELAINNLKNYIKHIKDCQEG